MKTPPPIWLKSGAVIGAGHPSFIVAEIGNNHQGEFEIAKRMIEVAAETGIQAVKFQKRDVDSLFTRSGREAPYTGANSFGRTYGEHRRALELSIDQMARLKEIAEDLGMVFFFSAWDRVSMIQLLDMEVELIKICSADLVNIPLLRQAGESGLPVILSTGMSELEDVDTAVNELASFHKEIVLLQCNGSYPCPDDQVGLPVIAELRRRYGLNAGYSGHERGLGASVAAAALGACVIERHFTLDKTMRGTDHQASLEPAEFKTLVKMVREVEAGLKNQRKQAFAGEREVAKKLRKSIFFSRDLPAGHILTEDDLAVKCPGTGVSPVHWREIIGASLLTSARHDEPFSWEMIASAPQVRRGLSLGAGRF
jgi:N-acetylneuraminate synthase/sialic acid synthase